MEKILTISIAAYNVENYIKKTLDSLIIEEILPKLEIFVIDDGGTDGTADIVEKYANKYPASISLIHKDNGGYGSTVNWSIEHATGKYFKLLDGDDWFESRNLTDYISRLEKSTADAVISNTYEIRDGKKIEKTGSLIFQDDEITNSFCKTIRSAIGKQDLFLLDGVQQIGDQ